MIEVVSLIIVFANYIFVVMQPMKMMAKLFTGKPVCNSVCNRFNTCGSKPGFCYRIQYSSLKWSTLKRKNSSSIDFIVHPLAKLLKITHLNLNKPKLTPFPPFFLELESIVQNATIKK